MKLFYFHISNLQNTWSFRKTNFQILESFTQFTHPKFTSTTASGFMWLFYENNTFLKASHNSPVLAQDPLGAFSFRWSFQLFTISTFQKTWSFRKTNSQILESFTQFIHPTVTTLIVFEAFLLSHFQPSKYVNHSQLSLTTF